MTTETTENTTTESTAGIAQPDRIAAIQRLAARRAAEQGIVQEPDPAPTPAQPTADAQDDFVEDIEDGRRDYADVAGDEPGPDLYEEVFSAWEEGDTDGFRAAMQKRDQRVQREILTAVEQRAATERFMDEFSDIAADQALLAQANQKIIALQKSGLPLATAARQAGTEVRQAAQRQGRLRATKDTSTASAIAAMKRARGLPT